MQPAHAAETDPTPASFDQSVPLPSRGASRRAIGIGALLIPFNAYWIVRLERVLYGPYVSTISLFANVVFVLFVLVGLNALLRRFLPRLAFTQGEMLTLYTMLGISTSLAGLDGLGILNQMIPLGAWFGTSRHWTAFLNDFPSWLVVKDYAAARGHFIGNTSFYQPFVLRAWAAPIASWTAFMCLLMLVAYGINALIRKQWADRERLTFPIIWLPVEMTEEGTGTTFFRNRLMWAGFAIATGLGAWNGIAFLHPQIPAINVGITDLKQFLTTKPWSAIDWWPITFYPLCIGLGFLLPVDLLFSCWFFFLVFKLQVVVSNAMAWDTTPDFPFIKEQGFGAIMALFGYYLWTARSAIFRADRDTPGDQPESLSRRAALACIGAGSLGLYVFCAAAGVTWWVIVAFFLILFATFVVVTRLRAELGAPVHDFHFMGPDNMLTRMVGTTALRRADLVFFTFGFSLTRAHRSDAMPVALEGLQMAKMRGIEQRRMLTAILVATFIGTVAALWAYEAQAYSLGVASKFEQGFGHGVQAFDRLSAWVAGSQDLHTNRGAVTAMTAGALITVVLLFFRLRMFGFPFHPIGFAISSSWAINLLWVPMLIAWILKSLTMRYGGLRAYRLLLPFFLGLVLGDCVQGSIWALVSVFWNIRTYSFFGA